mmetsp:Transcript_36773/g.89041  ORF Transcript_36773/g.89041 Transcript_36773/m.89041 type:complete len:202 (+) Transcript_36773:7215-7820(+)
MTTKLPTDSIKRRDYSVRQVRAEVRLNKHCTHVCIPELPYACFLMPSSVRLRAAIPPVVPNREVHHHPPLRLLAVLGLPAGPEPRYRPANHLAAGRLFAVASLAVHQDLFGRIGTGVGGRPVVRVPVAVAHGQRDLLRLVVRRTNLRCCSCHNRHNLDPAMGEPWLLIQKCAGVIGNKISGLSSSIKIMLRVDDDDDENND